MKLVLLLILTATLIFPSYADATNFKATNSFELDSEFGWQSFSKWVNDNDKNRNCFIGEFFYPDKIYLVKKCLQSIGYFEYEFKINSNSYTLLLGASKKVSSVNLSSSFNDDFTFSQTFNDSLIGKRIDKNLHLSAMQVIEKLNFIKEAKFNYIASSGDTYKIDIAGLPVESEVGFSTSLSFDNTLLYNVSGRHYFEYFGMRFFDYSLGKNSYGKVFYNLDIPVYYDAKNITILNFNKKPSNYDNFSTESSSIKIENSYHIFNTKRKAVIKAGLSISKHDSNVFNGRSIYFSKDLLFKDIISVNGSYTSKSVFGDLDSVRLNFELLTSRAKMSNVTSSFEMKYSIPDIYFNENIFLSNDISYKTINSKDFVRLPLDKRLYLGGPKTVRGYKTNYYGSSLDNNQFGGNQLIYTQSELVHEVPIKSGELDVGLFFDNGQIKMKNSNKITINSAGIFLRYKITKDLTISMYAAETSKNLGEQPFGVHISYGLFQ
jgi:hypothetical protein